MPSKISNPNPAQMLVRAKDYGAITPEQFDQLLAAIHCLTLFFYGDASWIPLPSPTRLALLTDHRLIQLPGAGHWLHHERLDQVAADIASFFKDNPHHG